MPGRALSPPRLTVTLLAAVWLTVGRRGASGAPGATCDNGKLYLERDLPVDDSQWDCAEFAWPETTQRHSSIDSVNNPEPVKQICMDKPINYDHSLPSSGSYRPVRAESGEYIYCPPQRWLNNLHHGSTVFLYHPCAPPHQRHLLSELGRSCIEDYIMTPHPQLNTPIALVSWGCTLELSTVASSVCDWLVNTQTSAKKVNGATLTMKYDLLLTWSAQKQRLEQPSKMKDLLRQCCEQTVSSLMNGTMETSMRKEDFKDMKSRKIRAASEGIQEGYNTINNNSTVLNNETNTSVSPKTWNAKKSSNILEDQPRAPPRSNISTFPKRNDSLRLKTLSSHRGVVLLPTPKQKNIRKLDSSSQTHVLSDGLTSEQNHTEALIVNSKNKGTDSRNEVKEKSFNKDNAADLKMKNNEVIDIQEREVGPIQRHNLPHSHQKSVKTAWDSTSRSEQNTQAASPTMSGTAVGVQGLPRTPRTDEAVWAAAALGFLLILLTLSVLHTRLYRYWRTAPSHYWHDPRQDYDSVADVIRRRLQFTKIRRKRRSRQECVLLPSSSSSDESP